MALATSDYAFVASIVLALAGVYSRTLGLPAVWEEIFGIGAAGFLILTVMLRRRRSSKYIFSGSRDSTGCIRVWSDRCDRPCFGAVLSRIEAIRSTRRCK